MASINSADACVLSEDGALPLQGGCSAISSLSTDVGVSSYAATSAPASTAAVRAQEPASIMGYNPNSPFFMSGPLPLRGEQHGLSFVIMSSPPRQAP